MAASESEKRLRNRKIVFYTVSFFFILGIVAIVYSSYMGNPSKKGILTLHGWVEGTEVILSSKVTGNIVKLPVDEGVEVKAQDLILQVDSKQISSQLDASSAQVATANEALKRAINNVAVLESKVEGATILSELTQNQADAKIKEASAAKLAIEQQLKQAEFNCDKAGKDYKRFLALVKKKNISQSKMDSIEETYNVCKSKVESSQNDLDKSKAALVLAKTTLSEAKLKRSELETLKRELEKSKTEVEMAKTSIEFSNANKNKIAADLDDTLIYSPINGIIVEKFVELGEHVVPGTPTVLIIDMNTLYIKTYVEQIDVGKVKYNHPAQIYVDSFPDRSFEGKITFISPKAEFTPRDVQMDEHRSRIVYKVEIGINNPEGILKPGMPADVQLKWDKGSV
jgi:HlyD family secretion protein